MMKASVGAGDDPVRPGRDEEFRMGCPPWSSSVLYVVRSPLSDVSSSGTGDLMPEEIRPRVMGVAKKLPAGLSNEGRKLRLHVQDAQTPLPWMQITHLGAGEEAANVRCPLLGPRGMCNKAVDGGLYLLALLCGREVEESLVDGLG